MPRGNPEFQRVYLLLLWKFRSNFRIPSHYCTWFNCAYIFKEQGMRRNKLQRMAGYGVKGLFAWLNNSLRQYGNSPWPNTICHCLIRQWQRYLIKSYGAYKSCVWYIYTKLCSDVVSRKETLRFVSHPGSSKHLIFADFVYSFCLTLFHFSKKKNFLILNE